MSSIVVPTGVALLGGADLTSLVTIAASGFLALSVVFFTAIAVGPHVKPSALSEDQKTAVIGLGAALAGTTWMVALLLAASKLS
ncbi:hypothetical protein C479_06841 [Halovivax asiaticus JCM 14624]|uniref:Uncharacterized protein n=1 Tax=Halovivax asiaticus JCM 14624 TaxID=1227490 RepID=M0BL34_9EURY|nr:hypothetical protein [Halovivax asiaticus]ELZ11560.1 hypothetical protein C479_06841 [Halovivax asiaticus JCM 14624]